jgi:uncharacterized membrane protein
MYRPYQTPPPSPSRPVWPWVLVGGAFAAVVLVLLYVLYWAPVPAGGGRPYFGYYGGGLLLVFFLVLLGFFALRMALWSAFRPRYRGYPGRAGRMRDPAVMAARQRYARGEITREQYEQIMTDLGRRPGGP